MSKKNIFGFQEHTWFGKLSKMYPFNVLGAYLAKVTGAEMTNADKEKADYEDAIADENADEAYRKQKEFQEQYLTPEAVIKSQAAGYEAVGLNKMMMAGTQPGASASSAPVSSGGTAGSSAGSGDLLGTLSSLIGVSSQAMDLKASADLKKSQKEHQDIVNKYTEESEKIRIQNERYQGQLMQANIRKVSAEGDAAEWYALFAPDLFQNQIDVGDSQVAKAYSDIEKNVSEISVNEARVSEINSIVSKNRKEIEQIDHLIDKIDQEYWTLCSQEDLNRHLITEADARTAKHWEEIKEIGSRINLNEEDLKYYIWNHPRQNSVAGIRWNTSSKNGANADITSGLSDVQLMSALVERGVIPKAQYDEWYSSSGK